MKLVPIYNKSTNESYLYDDTKSHLRVSSVIQAKQIGLSGEYIFACWNSLCEDEMRQGKLIVVLPEYEAYRQEFFLVSKKTINTVEQRFIDFIYNCMNRVIAT